MSPLLPVRIAPLVILSCAHVGRRGAASPDGQLTEETYSKRIVFAAADALRARGIAPAVVEKPLGGDRIQFINSLPAVCLVEPHLNAAVMKDKWDSDHDGDTTELVPDPKAGGVLTLHAPGKGEALAGELLATLSQALPGRRVLGAKVARPPWTARNRFEILDDVNVPSCIVECLHVTNPAEVRWLLQPDSPAILGEAIAAGVSAWLYATGSM